MHSLKESEYDKPERHLLSEDNYTYLFSDLSQEQLHLSVSCLGRVVSLASLFAVIYDVATANGISLVAIARYENRLERLRKADYKRFSIKTFVDLSHDLRISPESLLSRIKKQAVRFEPTIKRTYSPSKRPVIDLTSALGLVLRSLRQQCEYELEAAATISGIKAQRLREIEEGVLSIKLAQIQNLAALYKLTVSQLFAQAEAAARQSWRQRLQEEIGCELKKRRLQKGFSCAQLSTLTGVPRLKIVEMESRCIFGQDFELIARSLATSAAELTVLARMQSIEFNEQYVRQMHLESARMMEVSAANSN